MFFIQEWPQALVGSSMDRVNIYDTSPTYTLPDSNWFWSGVLPEPGVVCLIPQWIFLLSACPVLELIWTFCTHIVFWYKNPSFNTFHKEAPPFAWFDCASDKIHLLVPSSCLRRQEEQSLPDYALYDYFVDLSTTPWQILKQLSSRLKTPKPGLIHSSHWIWSSLWLSRNFF